METEKREIIWISGPSAIGKRTLIEKGLRGSEGAPARNLIGIPERFNHFPENLGVGLGKVVKRDNLRLIVDAARPVVLVKWQTATSDYPELIGKEFAGIAQRMLCLWRSLPGHLPDYVRKHGKSEAALRSDRKTNYRIIGTAISSLRSIQYYDLERSLFMDGIPEDPR